MPPLFRKVDCLRIAVPDLDAGLAFYRDALGHDLIWRTATAAGLGTANGEAEIVIHTDGHGTETDLMVDSVLDAVATIVAAGGTVITPSFDIQIGQCAVVADPWDNPLVILDATEGLFRTDTEGNVLGNDRPR